MTAKRLAFVDLFRGLLMAHMALDHCSLFFNEARWNSEFWHDRPPPPADLAQFLTRFTGVFVAPGFSFMAGFMIAVTSDRRAGRGTDEGAITRRLMLRGLILIVVEALLLELPMKRYHFEVLACLGVSMILVALVRRWPTAALLPVAVAILALHPLLAGRMPDNLFGRLLHDTRELGRFRALYPLLPWIGIMLFGFVVGRDFHRHPDAARRWTAWAIGFAALFLLVRLPASYGNAFGYERVMSYDFFIWSKYPPDLAWLAWSFATVFVLLALLLRFQDRLMEGPVRLVAAFGRVPFFFYVVHFYVVGSLALVVAPRLHRALPLWAVYAIWGALMVALWKPCDAYFAYKERHPRTVWRYF